MDGRVVFSNGAYVADETADGVIRLDRADSRQAYDSGDDLMCGYGRCAPKWLQRFHTASYLMATLSLCSIAQSFIVNGIIPISISTLEKRFHLTSTQTGLLAATYDIAVTLVLVPVCHWGARGHKGRMLGIGMLIMAMGAFVGALPQFTTPAYEFGQEAAGQVCVRNATQTSCDTSGRALSNYLYVFLLGQTLIGIGASPLYTLGVAFIDESVSQGASPVYLGLYTAFGTVGPAVGFIAGAFLLRIYGDVGKVDVSTLDLSGPSDPRWYGAWWIGFLVTGVMSLVFVIPVLGFARELPGARRHRLKDIDQANQAAGDSSVAFGADFKHLLPAVCQLFRNSTFLAIVAMQTAEAFMLNGFITFVPKVFENLFTFSPSTSSLVTGAIVVPCGFAGTVFGGWLIRRFKLQCSKLILLALAFNVVSASLVGILLIECPDVPFAGVTEPYVGSASGGGGNLSAECNADCHCGDDYTPVCSPELRLTYYSPCRAGCDDGSLTARCRCVVERAQSLGVHLRKTGTTRGLCDNHCSSVTIFMVGFAVLVFATFCSAMPVQQTMLRCVPFSQRTLALGFAWIFIRVLGSIPGAITFGAAIDRTCILWKTQCGERQSCIRYGGHSLAVTILLFGVTLKSIIIVSLFLAWWSYRAPASKDFPQRQASESNVTSARIKPLPQQLAATHF